MGAKAKHDIAPVIRGAFLNALALIEKDTGKTFPEMMRDCIEDHGLLAVMDKVSKYTVREKNTTLETKPTIESVSAIVVDEWIKSFQSSGQLGQDTTQSMGDEAISPTLDKPRIQ